MESYEIFNIGDAVTTVNYLSAPMTVISIEGNAIVCRLPSSKTQRFLAVELMPYLLPDSPVIMG